MKKWQTLTALLLLTSNVQANWQGIKQVGYFKDQERNRVYSMRLEHNISPQTIVEISSKKPHTAGQVTAIYYYEADAQIPADYLTLAKNLYAANQAIDNSLSPWRYVYIVYINGKAEFIDCKETPASMLCKQ